MTNSLSNIFATIADWIQNNLNAIVVSVVTAILLSINKWFRCQIKQCYTTLSEKRKRKKAAEAQLRAQKEDFEKANKLFLHAEALYYYSHSYNKKLRKLRWFLPLHPAIAIEELYLSMAKKEAKQSLEIYLSLSEKDRFYHCYVTKAKELLDKLQ